MIWFRRKSRRLEVEVHEIFMDVKNVSDFNVQQFEGALEQPISKKSILMLGGFALCIGIIFFGWIFKLQIWNGQKYFSISESNRLQSIPIFAHRGVIYDRKQNELAWNVSGIEGEPFFYREYISQGGFAHILGYVQYPEKDSKGVYWRNEVVGRDGIEQLFNERLRGTNGSKIIETDVHLEPQSENLVIAPKDGQSVTLSIDKGVEEALYNGILSMAEAANFQGGAGVIMDVHTGEILALASYPEFDPNVMSRGTDAALIKSYFTSSQKPFLDRVIGGLYTPGSIVKPYLALAALQEGLVTPDTKIMSTGTIEIQNPYNKEQKTIFRDWRPKGHGITDLNHAIADSVNTYFYSIGGGYKSQAGLGITRIASYVQKFKIGQKSGIDLKGEVGGVVPTPEWKKKNFADGTWRLGDTYNTSIGQYGFQVTPIQMVRAVAAMANGGTLVTPHVVLDPAFTGPTETIPDIKPEYFQDVRTAMRHTVTEGTAQRLNVPYVQVAAKSGTAQVGVNTEYENSWITGFFPYEHPRYAFVVVMERAPSANESGASGVIRTVVEWMYNNAPEYYAE